MKRATTRLLIYLLFFLILTFITPSAARAQEITIVAAGDINLGGRVNNIIKQNGYFYPISRLKPILSQADLTFGNLECSLSYQGKPVPGKEFTFRGSPENLRTLQAGGFDLVSIANNHSKDFGEEAFLDTLKNLKLYGIKPVGGGNNRQEALSPAIVKRNGLKIAFLAFSGVLPYGWAASDFKPGVASLRNFEQVKETIAKARRKADLVVVSLHWGIELSPRPSKEQEKLAYQLIEAGATLVIGHHPHILQKIEVYKNGLIAYSLGNFIFTPGSPRGSKSALIQIKMDEYGVKSFRVWPVKITNARPEIAREGVAKEIKKFLLKESRAGQAGLKDEGESLFYESYRSQKSGLFNKLTRSFFLF